MRFPACFGSFLRSLHPSLAVLATGSGKRNFTPSMAIDSSDEESEDEEDEEEPDCSLKFWSVRAT